MGKAPPTLMSSNHNSCSQKCKSFHMDGHQQGQPLADGTTADGTTASSTSALVRPYARCRPGTQECDLSAAKLQLTGIPFMGISFLLSSIYIRGISQTRFAGVGSCKRKFFGPIWPNGQLIQVNSLVNDLEEEVLAQKRVCATQISTK